MSKLLCNVLKISANAPNALPWLRACQGTYAS